MTNLCPTYSELGVIHRFIGFMFSRLERRPFQLRAEVLDGVQDVSRKLGSHERRVGRCFWGKRRGVLSQPHTSYTIKKRNRGGLQHFAEHKECAKGTVEGRVERQRENNQTLEESNDLWGASA